MVQSPIKQTNIPQARFVQTGVFEDCELLDRKSTRLNSSH